VGRSFHNANQPAVVDRPIKISGAARRFGLA
jgi:hypothetical protein